MNLPPVPSETTVRHLGIAHGREDESQSFRALACLHRNVVSTRYKYRLPAGDEPRTVLMVEEFNGDQQDVVLKVEQLAQLQRFGRDVSQLGKRVGQVHAVPQARQSGGCRV
ncbi:hypothetical protein [Embleya sp. NPDC020886]|uniref:hypothetical protein n=1 Tax=Embleya sp. NPDC020886 TaxID=3363980 RepID=UPI003790E13F